MSQMPPPQPPMNQGMMRPHRGTMILVFGILSFVVCVIFGICAWVMGNGDLAAMERGEMDPSGYGMTKAGKIVGMVSVILNIVVIGLWIVLIVIGGVLGAMG